MAAPPPAAAPAAPGSLDAAALRQLWPETLEVVKKSSRRTRALLDNAQITEVDGELVKLSAPAALAKMIGEDSNTSVLMDALSAVVGGTWRVEVTAATGAPAGDDGPAPSHPQPAAARARAPEPDPRDEPDFEAGPHSGDAATVPATRDPEAQAIKLLSEQLGARPIEGG